MYINPLPLPLPQTDHCFVVIQVRADHQVPPPQPTSKTNTNFSAMKLFDRFRRILMRFIFSLPSSSSSRGSHSHPQTNNGSSSSSSQRSCDRPDPPKTSCSTYYSSNTHYNEAIADCIDFFNKSSQEGRKSDVMV